MICPECGRKMKRGRFGVYECNCEPKHRRNR